ncbi:MAG: arylesterase [Proteobacteria bacterium]|nr:arylesterase [Pseudomonadota bacterium]
MIGRIRTAFHNPLQAPRRAVLLGGLAAACAAAASGQAAPPVATLFGDSIVAGYGLPPADRMARQLELALAGLGVAATVRDAGVPGDPSPGGLARLSASVRGDTAVCVVEFGGNDRRLGLPQAVTRDSLDGIVKQLTARGVTVIVAGNGGLDRLQREVAEAHGAIFYPDIFAGAAPGMRLPDGVHPDAAGERAIAKALAPVVAQALRER